MGERHGHGRRRELWGALRARGVFGAVVQEAVEEHGHCARGGMTSSPSVSASCVVRRAIIYPFCAVPSCSLSRSGAGDTVSKCFAGEDQCGRAHRLLSRCDARCEGQADASRAWSDTYRKKIWRSLESGNWLVGRHSNRLLSILIVLSRWWRGRAARGRCIRCHRCTRREGNEFVF